MSEIQREIKETRCLVIAKSDSSVYPSYSNLIIPQRVICRRRYHKDILTHNKQFLHEVATQEALQRKALDGVRVHRIFCNPVLSPPSTDDIITLSPDEQRKVERLLEYLYFNKIAGDEYGERGFFLEKNEWKSNQGSSVLKIEMRLRNTYQVDIQIMRNWYF